ncbi:MAG TPA: hypothetical protein PKI03_27420 [Pseudomonadota bacterium]|nr:hypothetical protein [Pseudomonadota bacterium]
MNPPASLSSSPLQSGLSLDDLRAFGVVPSQVRAFRTLLESAADGEGPNGDGGGLLPLQAQAVRAGLLAGNGGAYLVAGGVGTGKSLLAKLLLLHSQHSGERVGLLLASATERRRARAQLATIWPAAEVQSAILSPAQLLRRLRREPRCLAELDGLLIDSLESWLGPRRRRVFASLLRHLQAASSGLRVVAFVAEEALATAATQFARPLSATLICGPGAAPPPVFQLHGGWLRACLLEQPAVAAPAPELGLSLQVPPLDGEVLCDAVGAEPVRLRESLLTLAQRGEKTLVLVPQLSQRLRLLHALIARNPPRLPAAEQALAELAGTAAGHGQDLLRAALSHGVALDGDELTPAQRGVVQRAQARGEVRLTISQRLGRSPAPGTGMDNIVCLAAATPGGQDGAGAQHREPDFRRNIKRRLRAGGRVLLACRSRAQCDHWAAALLTEGLVENHEPQRRMQGHRGWPTGLRFLSRAAGADSAGAVPLEILTRTALFGRVLPLPLLLSEPAQADYLTLLLSRAQSYGLQDQPVFRWLAHQGGLLRHDDLRALKAVLMLDDWLDGLPGPELERRYHVFLGWLVRCARSLARRLGRLRRLERPARPDREGLGQLIGRLRRIDPDGVAEHGMAPIGRHVSAILGALQAQDTALHVRPGPRQVSRR